MGSIFPPATLGVQLVLQSKTLMVKVPTLDISQQDSYQFFAFFASRQDAKGNELQKFLGPRSLAARLAEATATTGEILPIAPPFTNATYKQIFYGPYVKCHDTNTSISKQIDISNNRRRSALNPAIREIQNCCWAYVAVLDEFNATMPLSNIKIANLSEPNGALHASNQLWLRYPRSNGSDISFDLTQRLRPHYLVCELHNASYHVNFTWVNVVQSLIITDLDILGSIP